MALLISLVVKLAVMTLSTVLLFKLIGALRGKALFKGHLAPVESDLECRLWRWGHAHSRN